MIKCYNGRDTPTQCWDKFWNYCWDNNIIPTTYLKQEYTAKYMLIGGNEYYLVFDNAEYESWFILQWG